MERTSRQTERPIAATDGDEQQDAGARRRLAVTALFTALAAGVVEMAAHLWPFDDLADNAGAVVIRLTIYALIAVVIVRFARGREWARLLLLVGLGVIGTASLLVEPVMWLFDDADVGAYFSALDGPGTVILVSRVVHLAAVAVGVTAMVTLHPRSLADVTE
ncbi:hypothetical protein [Brevibacterium pigmentatum]|uniref:hypothetical protein n=1 Tax=Brevibacterium pigmentatum TaxID=1496080 RepID=UPI0014202C36|nr:hypothetical protein [Brevibacterium pigmentatum]